MRTQVGIVGAGPAGLLLGHLLHLNGIIAADEVMDATSLPKVKMPNRGGFTSAFKPGR